MPLQIKLDDNLEDEFRQSIQEIYKTAIDEARRDVGLLKEFLTVQEASELIQVSKSTFIRNFIDEGLDVYKIETKTFVKKSELNQFIENHKI